MNKYIVDQSVLQLMLDFISSSSNSNMKPVDIYMLVNSLTNLKPIGPEKSPVPEENKSDEQ